MHQTKLIQLLKGLDQEEVNRFSKFVRSPFYNTNPTVVKLFEVLKSAHPDYTARRLKKETVFQKLYPGKPFHYQLMNNLRRQLAQLVREYFVVLENEQDGFLKKKTLVQAYGKRNMYVFYEKGTARLVEEIEKTPNRDVQYYLDKMELRNKFYLHPLTSTYRLAEDYGLEMLALLDKYYTLNKIKMSTELQVRSPALFEKINKDLLGNVLELAAQKFADNNSLFLLYPLLFNLNIKKDDDDNFRQANKLYKENIEKINGENRGVILGHLINYSVQKINNGIFEFYREAFELYRFGLEQKILIEKNKITEITFNNIVSLGGILQEYNWCVDFIEEYGKLLDESIREYVLALANAELAFRKGNYNEVIGELLNADFPMALYKLKAKHLLVQSYFESYSRDEKYFEFLLAQIEAFEKFTRRNKELDSLRKKGILHFLSAVKYLTMNKVDLESSHEAKAKYQQKIKGQRPLFGKSWLMEKIEQL